MTIISKLGGAAVLRSLPGSSEVAKQVVTAGIKFDFQALSVYFRRGVSIG